MTSRVSTSLVYIDVHLYYFKLERVQQHLPY